MTNPNPPPSDAGMERAAEAALERILHELLLVGMPGKADSEVSDDTRLTLSMGWIRKLRRIANDTLAWAEMPAPPAWSEPVCKESLRTDEPHTLAKAATGGENATPAHHPVITRETPVAVATSRLEIMRSLAPRDLPPAERNAWAENRLRELEVAWVLDEKDSAAFVDALLIPPAPNDALKAAAKRYKSDVLSDRVVVWTAHKEALQHAMLAEMLLLMPEHRRLAMTRIFDRAFPEPKS